MTQNVSQLGARYKQSIGRVGDFAELDLGHNHVTDNLVIEAGPLAAVFEVNIEDAALSAADVLGLRIGGFYDVVVDGGASGTLATDVADLLAALQADSVVSGYFETIEAFDSDAGGGDDAIRLTARAKGYPYTLEPATGSSLTVVQTVEPTFGAPLATGKMVFFPSSAKGSNATTAQPGSGDVEDICAGIVHALYARESTSLTASNNDHDARRDTVVARTGPVIVRGGAGAERNGDVYLGNPADAAELGELFTATGTGRLLIPRTYAKWIAPHIVHLNLGR